MESFQFWTSSFNTQPPEGGWLTLPDRVCTLRCFNTQPPEGGWFVMILPPLPDCSVSTHSRLKAAGNALGLLELPAVVSTHSRLKAAGPVN